MSKPPKKPFRVVGGHRRPPQPVEPSVPPAHTPEERTAFAEALTAHLPGSWHLVPDVPDTITFEAEFRGTRRAWEYTAPVRLLRRDPQPGGLLLVWAARKHSNHDGYRDFIVAPEDLYVAGLVTDATTPAALGQAIEYADHRSGEPLEVSLYRFHAENRSAGGTGWTARWVAECLAKDFLPRYLKHLPRLRRELAQRDRAKAKEEKRREQEKQYRKAATATIAKGAGKLRALGYEPMPSDPDTFVPPFDPKTSRRAPHVFLSAHHFNNYVDARVVLRLSQLPALLRYLGHKTPRRKSDKTANPAGGNSSVERAVV
jgi:hypothetical protein